MKYLFIIFILTLTAQKDLSSQCNVGSYTVIGNQTITSSCTITGDLTISNGASLNVDFTSATADTLIVRGNILLQGNAVLWIHSTAGSTNDQFIVSNNYNGHRNITTKDSSKIYLEHVEFRTQEGNLTGVASIFMDYSAEDTSLFYINKSWLNIQTGWLLCHLKNKATLIGVEPNSVPTEMYLEDSVKVVLQGSNTNIAGIWLSCLDITDTLNLPPDQSIPFTWKVGRGVGGFSSPWYLEMDTVKSFVGVQIFPSTKLTVNGTGTPNSGELKVAMIFANNTDTIKNLTVGLQNTTVNNGPLGRVTLNNVNLGPLAWQMYALMNENLFIKNSIVNEIGIFGPSNISVDSSLLQLAVLTAVGTGGSSMTINNTEIWNQEISAANNSDIFLNNCDVYGSIFRASDTLSSITANGGCFFQNPSGCTSTTAINITTGQPYCNPLIPAAFPQNLTPATVSFIGVNTNCTVGLIETLENEGITIFPNPFSVQTTLHSGKSFKDASLIVYNSLGQTVKRIDNLSGQDVILNRNNLPGGLYFIRITQDSKLISADKFVIVDK